ncbi:hypothetical protein B0H11DRAFT_2203352 [Mycena galericulata]|nr:hypothetical protein B0H11DRAFT_2203352 [Mycena galericulata]
MSHSSPPADYGVSEPVSSIISLRSDEDLVREHHVKMALRIKAIDLELRNIGAQYRALEQIKIDNDMIAYLNDLRRERTRSEFTRPKLIKERDDPSPMMHQLDAQISALKRESIACPYIITTEMFRLSPIRRIPTDILIDIFVCAKEDEPQRLGTGVGPLFARVCGRWRDVACSYPLLWSSFSFPLFGKETTADLLEITLARCRLAPLTVIVDGSERADNGYSGERKMAVLATHADQIASLTFWGKERFLSDSRVFPAFHSFRGHLSHLELLSFPQMWCVVGDAFEFAPCLHSLELGRSAELLESKYKIPHAQIRSLRFSTSTSGYHLSSFPNLTSMTSVQTDASPPVRVTRDAPPLVRLAVWTVSFDELAPSDSMIYFFARFLTPALSSLDISRLKRTDGVLGLLRRSHCDLTSLVFRQADFPAADLLHLLQVTPNLETLEIIDCASMIVSDVFFDEMTARAILPSLVRFTLRGSYGEFATQKLLDMLDSRTLYYTPGLAMTTVLRVVVVMLHDRVIAPNTVQHLTEIEGISVKFGA